jgi:hypothetical protein
MKDRVAAALLQAHVRSIGERGLPRSYGARTYRDIRSWRDLAHGAHFTAWQVPGTIADEIATFAHRSPGEQDEDAGGTHRR